MAAWGDDEGVFSVGACRNSWSAGIELSGALACGNGCIVVLSVCYGWLCGPCDLCVDLQSRGSVLLCVGERGVYSDPL